MKPWNIQKKHPDFVIYQTDENVAKVSVRLEEETVWPTQKQLEQKLFLKKDVLYKYLLTFFCIT